jgi:putative transposase
MANAKRAKKHPNWGGRRPGAGRKPKGDKPMVSHARRPKIQTGSRIEIRWQLDPEIELRGARAALASAMKAGSEGTGFKVARASLRGRVAEFRVSARDSERLARGMQGLAIRFARALNRVVGRKGRVFVDRYEVKEA